MNDGMNAIEAALELTKVIGKDDPNRTVRGWKEYYLSLYAECYKVITRSINESV